jgi:hypothetical protein
MISLILICKIKNKKLSRRFFYAPLVPGLLAAAFVSFSLTSLHTDAAQQKFLPKFVYGRPIFFNFYFYSTLLELLSSIRICIDIGFLYYKSWDNWLESWPKINSQKQLFYLICHNSSSDKPFLALFFIYSELNSLFFGILEMHIDCLVFEIFNKLSNAFSSIFD